MKTLQTYVNEWKANDLNVPSIKKTSLYLTYKLKEKDYISVFGMFWPLLDEYRDKIYIKDKQIKLYHNNGNTVEKYDPGTYEIEIKDIDKVTNCSHMFFACKELVKISLFDTSKVTDMKNMFTYCENLESVPKFNTKNVKDMNSMFANCYKLKEVPLFDTSNVRIMICMFTKCDNLNEKTKREWSKVYNFKKNTKNEIITELY